MSTNDVLGIVAMSGLSSFVSVATVAALSGWLGKIWADRILEKDKAKYQEEMESIRIRGQQDLERLKQDGQELLEKLKLGQEKRLLAHRLQYETEFGIYTDLWATICKLNRMAWTRRELATREERDKACEDFEEVFYRHSPFLPLDVVQVARKIHSLVAKSDYLTTLSSSEKDASWEEYMREYLHEFDELAEKLAIAIRARIWSEEPVEISRDPDSDWTAIFGITQTPGP